MVWWRCNETTKVHCEDAVQKQTAATGAQKIKVKLALMRKPTGSNYDVDVDCLLQTCFAACP